MARPKKKKRKKKGPNPKLVKLIVELVRDPSGAQAASDELNKLAQDAAAITSALADAHAITDDPDDADSFAKFDALPFVVQLAVLDIVAEEGAVGFLARLDRDVEDKRLSKAVGAAIQKARAEGLDVPDLKERKSVSFDAVAEPPPSSYTTAIDGDGNRVVVAARTGTRGLDVFYALIGDTEGIQHFEGVPMPRGGYRRFVRTIEAQVHATMVPIEFDYASALLNEAREANGEAGNPVPPQYLDARAIFVPPDDTGAPIWKLIDASEIEKDEILVKRSVALHDLHEFMSWAPDGDGVEILINELGDLKDVDRDEADDETSDKIDDAVRASVKKWFTTEMRERIARRLEENAFVIWHTDREDDARVCAATALALRSDADILDVPFAVRLFDKLIGSLAGLELPSAEEKAESAAADSD